MTVGQGLHLSHHVRHALGGLHGFEERHCSCNYCDRSNRLVHSQNHRSTGENRIDSVVHQSDQEQHQSRKRQGFCSRPWAFLHGDHDQYKNGQQREYHVHDISPRTSGIFGPKDCAPARSAVVQTGAKLGAEHVLFVDTCVFETKTWRFVFRVALRHDNDLWEQFSLDSFATQISCFFGRTGRVVTFPPALTAYRTVLWAGTSITIVLCALFLKP
mmetsp:Transcript_9383/g.22805  ORF Transcript_9383/g.22805 Transcript_9383/m.22805 type:complete len:215 (+) Transcript_9383:1311-1955(+)